jgi:translation elongation factor P/translation initiation factor 5A
MGAASNHLVKLEKTRSGTFVIENGKIYEVLELPTSKVNFQDVER